MVTNSQNRAELATECHDLPLGREENQSTNYAVEGPSKPTSTNVCGECQHAGGPDRRRHGEVFSDHENIIPLYEVNIGELAGPYQREFSQERAEIELGRAGEALEMELAVSQRVKTTELEEMDLGEDGHQWPVLVAKNLPEDFKTELAQTLREYRDVFASSYEDMKGLDP